MFLRIFRFGFSRTDDGGGRTRTTALPKTVDIDSVNISHLVVPHKYNPFLAPPDEEMVEGVRGSHHTQVASALFPSILCSAVVEIVALLDDAAVSRDGCSVYEVAYQVSMIN